MSRRLQLALAIVAILILIPILSAPAGASRAELNLRDTLYVSPTWGYLVRWYGDEWSVTEETSSNGSDRLQLTDALGSIVTFEGRSGYQGDARTCLDDQLERIAAEGGQDIVILTDDRGRPQKIYHPWRSWMALLASFDEAGEPVDQIVFLDCRTLAMDEAVLIRDLRTPAATYTDELWHLDVLNAAFPRGAWFGNIYLGLDAPGLDRNWAETPLPADSLVPWDYPTDPVLLAGENEELGMMTVADGEVERRDFVVMIENSGTAPLLIQPDRFRIANDPLYPGTDPESAPDTAVWTDGTAPGERAIAPGAWASLTLDFPTMPEPAAPQNLVYRDAALLDGEATLNCVAQCGFGGGGSRPRVRISR